MQGKAIGEIVFPAACCEGAEDTGVWRTQPRRGRGTQCLHFAFHQTPIYHRNLGERRLSISYRNMPMILHMTCARSCPAV